MAKQKRDEELQRIEAMMRTLNELNDRFWKLKHRCGAKAQSRGAKFLLDRYDWLFNDINNAARN